MEQSQEVASPSVCRHHGVGRAWTSQAGAPLPISTPPDTSIHHRIDATARARGGSSACAWVACSPSETCGARQTRIRCRDGLRQQDGQNRRNFDKVVEQLKGWAPMLFPMSADWRRGRLEAWFEMTRKAIIGIPPRRDHCEYREIRPSCRTSCGCACGQGKRLPRRPRARDKYLNEGDCPSASATACASALEVEIVPVSAAASSRTRRTGHADRRGEPAASPSDRPRSRASMKRKEIPSGTRHARFGVGVTRS